jgi:hypothetical protein
VGTKNIREQYPRGLRSSDLGPHEERSKREVEERIAKGVVISSCVDIGECDGGGERRERGGQESYKEHEALVLWISR